MNRDLIFKMNDGIAEVHCSATGLCIGTILKELNGSWRYFQDNIDYPLLPKHLRAIAEYMEYLGELQ